MSQLIALLCTLTMASACSALAQDGTATAAAHLDSAAAEIAVLKDSVLDAFANLQHAVETAEETSSKWEDLAKPESDPGKKAISVAFQNSFAAHARSLVHLGQQLVRLSQTADGMESVVKLAVILLADVRRLRDTPGSQGQMSTDVRRTRESLSLFQQRIVLLGKEIGVRRDELTGYGKTLIDHDKKLRELLASVGDPVDPMKRWDKEVIITELKNNATEARHLAKLSVLGAKMIDPLLNVGKATEALQLVVGAP